MAQFSVLLSSVVPLTVSGAAMGTRDCLSSHMRVFRTPVIVIDGCPSSETVKCCLWHKPFWTSSINVWSCWEVLSATCFTCMMQWWRKHKAEPTPWTVGSAVTYTWHPAATARIDPRHVISSDATVYSDSGIYAVRQWEGATTVTTLAPHMIAGCRWVIMTLAA